MNIHDVLEERNIMLSLNAKNKDEVVTQLANRLKKHGYIRDVEAFKAAIYEREKDGSTGIGRGIAIPHGKSNSVIKVGVAIAKLQEAIEWESIDGKGVIFVILFAVSNNHEYAKNHMRLLAHIAGKLGDDETIEALLQAENSAMIKAILA